METVNADTSVTVSTDSFRTTRPPTIQPFFGLAAGKTLGSTDLGKDNYRHSGTAYRVEGGITWNPWDNPLFFRFMGHLGGSSYKGEFKAPGGQGGTSTIHWTPLGGGVGAEFGWRTPVKGLSLSAGIEGGVQKLFSPEAGFIQYQPPPYCKDGERSATCNTRTSRDTTTGLYSQQTGAAVNAGGGTVLNLGLYASLRYDIPYFFPLGATPYAAIRVGYSAHDMTPKSGGGGSFWAPDWMLSLGFAFGTPPSAAAPERKTEVKAPEPVKTPPSSAPATPAPPPTVAMEEKLEVAVEEGKDYTLKPPEGGWRKGDKIYLNKELVQEFKEASQDPFTIPAKKLQSSETHVIEVKHERAGKDDPTILEIMEVEKSDKPEELMIELGTFTSKIDGSLVVKLGDIPISTSIALKKGEAIPTKVPAAKVPNGLQKFSYQVLDAKGTEVGIFPGSTRGIRIIPPPAKLSALKVQKSKDKDYTFRRDPLTVTFSAKGRQEPRYEGATVARIFCGKSHIFSLKKEITDGHNEIPVYGQDDERSECRGKLTIEQAGRGLTPNERLKNAITKPIDSEGKNVIIMAYDPTAPAAKPPAKPAAPAAKPPAAPAKPPVAKPAATTTAKPPAPAPAPSAPEKKAPPPAPKI